MVDGRPRLPACLGESRLTTAGSGVGQCDYQIDNVRHNVTIKPLIGLGPIGLFHYFCLQRLVIN